MATQLAPTSTSLRTALVELNRRAPAINTITKVTVPCTTQIQQFFSHTLSVFKFMDANGAFPRAETTGGSESGSGVAGDSTGLNLRVNKSCIGDHSDY
jgi:hypothetical protein